MFGDEASNQTPKSTRISIAGDFANIYHVEFVAAANIGRTPCEEQHARIDINTRYGGPGNPGRRKSPWLRAHISFIIIFWSEGM